MIQNTISLFFYYLYDELKIKQLLPPSRWSSYEQTKITGTLL